MPDEYLDRSAVQLEAEIEEDHETTGMALDMMSNHPTIFEFEF